MLKKRWPHLTKSRRFSSNEVLLLLLASLTVVQANRICMKPVAGPFLASEEPHFDCQNGVLYFVDQLDGRICVYNPCTGRTDCSCQLVQNLGPVVPVQNSINQFLIGLGPYLATLCWDGCCCSEPCITILGRYDQGTQGAEFNDGKADCCGRMFIDTKGKKFGEENRAREASLFHYSKSNGSLQTDLDRDAYFYNGMAWDPTCTKFYLAESEERKVYAFDYDIQNGTISNRTVAFDLEAQNVTGFPDGMTIDCKGNLWVACSEGFQVVQIDPKEGRLKQSIQMPVRDPTSVTFGDCDLCTLYVTSTQDKLTKEEKKEQPLAGCVFAICGLGVSGLPANNADMLRSCCVGCGCQEGY